MKRFRKRETFVFTALELKSHPTKEDEVRLNLLSEGIVNAARLDGLKGRLTRRLLIASAAKWNARYFRKPLVALSKL